MPPQTRMPPAWCMRMPPATDTLKESTMPFIGILQCRFESPSAWSLIPLCSFSSYSPDLEIHLRESRSITGQHPHPSRIRRWWMNGALMDGGRANLQMPTDLGRGLMGKRMERAAVSGNSS
ncbi:unnamed protein product [Linum trigynum]|uniref:Uncharacterized protein n=1 Tax=Linum trigynum TaxID=586398 RepID=A0AAV2FRR5_9ROSI